MSTFGKLSYVILCAGAVVLAATGIGVFTLGKPPMTHWVLMAHIAAAPLFALGLAAVTLTCSGLGNHRGVAAKISFWLVVVCGLIVILTGVLPMTPLCGTAGQEFLYLTHRYAGIVLAIALVLHLAVRPWHTPSRSVP
jgi:cytochrome b subunit of formate dehydrogenase